MADRKGLYFESDMSTGLGQSVIEIWSYRRHPLPGGYDGSPDKER